MLKVRTLFSGIGSPERALKDLQIPCELIDFCEVDKYAVKSYCAVHGVSEDKNLGDITKVWGRNLPYADLLVWGFPCQDISVAGKQRGLKEGETRSGLYYEGFRILKETKPKYSIIENVKNLVGKKFKADFESMLEDIESLGYNNYWNVLNAKDYGIPQNRERVFIVSIRKDIDTGTFSFPKGFDNGLRLKDFLEHEVDEKYYISQEKTEKLIKGLNGKEIKGPGINVSKKGEQFENETDISLCLLARDYKGLGNQQMTAVCEPNVLRYERTEYGKEIRKQYESGLMNEKIGNMRELKPRADGISNTLTTVLKDNLLCIPCITPDRVEKRQNGRRFKEDGDPMFTLTGQDRHGIMQIETNKIKIVGTLKGCGMPWDKRHESTCRIYDPNGISPTVTAGGGGGVEPKILQEAPMPELIGGIGEINFGKQYRQGNRVYSSEKTAMCLMAQPVGNAGGYSYLYNVEYRIRKLTPKECWRLMGFKDEDFQKAADAGVSNSQLYKQAGNSIVTNCLFYIFKNLLQAEIVAICEEEKELS